MTDRMSDRAPRTIDGMKYMETSGYWQDGFYMDLAEDYEAIIWMQDHVEGSPVIVEASPTEYKWGSRFTVYTGLPGVVRILKGSESVCLVFRPYATALEKVMQ